MSTNKTKARRRLSLYDKLLLLHEHDLLPLVIRFAKSALFHISFESAITVYITEIFIILSRFFLINPAMLSGTLSVMIVPILIVAPISLVFAIISTLMFVNKLCDIVHRFNESLSTSALIKEHRQRLAWGHFMGAAFYILTPIVISRILVRYYSSWFLPDAKVNVSILVICGVLGALWNITGFFRDQRILWHHIIPNNQTAVIDLDEIASCNYKCLKWNFILNFFSLLPVVALFAITFFTLNNHLQSENALRAFTTNYRFLTIAFVSLIAIYIRYGYSLLYAEKNEAETIFPPLKAVLESRKRRDSEVQSRK